jgi:hypothetical protein
MASRPQVLELTGASPAAADAARRERARFVAEVAKGGVVHHLYPPRKGWVRLEPGSAGDAVSLPARWGGSSAT